jgi:hypothetical protein
LKVASSRNKESYEEETSGAGGIPKIVGLGIVSVASAIAGGLAMAWWHRKTISKLQNPIALESSSTPKSLKAEPESE